MPARTMQLVRERLGVGRRLLLGREDVARESGHAAAEPSRRVQWISVRYGSASGVSAPISRRTARSTRGSTGTAAMVAAMPAAGPPANLECCARVKCLVVTLALLVLAAPAQAQEPLALAAGAAETGYVDLTLHATPGVPVTIAEAGGPPLATLTPTAPDTRIRRAVPWRCDRRMRRFVATAADGTTAGAEVRTPSCRRGRGAPRRAGAGPGARSACRVTDRWGLGGGDPRCASGRPAGPGSCKAAPSAGRAAARRAAARAARRLARARPRAVADVTRPRRARRARPAAGADAGHGRLDDPAARRVPAHAAARDAGCASRASRAISTGISKPGLLDWPAHARAPGRAPAAGRDGDVHRAPTTDSRWAARPCCGDAWVAEYARRVRAMMEAYARGGRGRVYWLALPAPRAGRPSGRRSAP